MHLKCKLQEKNEGGEGSVDEAINNISNVYKRMYVMECTGEFKIYGKDNLNDTIQEHDKTLKLNPR